MKRLHIVGCPRSGTTLLMELVSTCFASDGFCEHELSIFEPIEDTADIYFTKQPNDIRQLGHIFGRDEQLFVIYMGRDPRAVITSKHREDPQQYFCNYRVWRECDQAAIGYENHPRFLRLRYEDLVTDADAVEPPMMASSLSLSLGIASVAMLALGVFSDPIFGLLAGFMSVGGS